MKPLEVTGETDKRGTEVHFLASKDVRHDRVPLRHPRCKRLRELSFLNNGCAIELIDQRTGKSESFAQEGA
jgi:DNA gyrase subunit B